MQRLTAQPGSSSKSGPTSLSNVVPRKLGFPLTPSISHANAVHGPQTIQRSSGTRDDWSPTIAPPARKLHSDLANAYTSTRAPSGGALTRANSASTDSAGKLEPAEVSPGTRVKRGLGRFWSAYQRRLKSHPVQSKALTSCVGLILADCIAQLADGGGYDASRTARMATFGLFWHGVSGHYWYGVLDKFVMPKRASHPAAIVSKTLLDQAIWSPLNTMVFYASLAAMEGQIHNIPEILDEKLVPTVIAGYMLWPLAHLVNFKFVPSKHRLLYINVVNLFWTIYLSRCANAPAGSVPPVDGTPSAPSFPSGVTPIPVNQGGAPAPMPPAPAPSGPPGGIHHA